MRPKRRAREGLRRGGRLLIFVPALPALYSPFDAQIGHFRRYVKRELAALVERHGFAVRRARYFDVAGILPWYVAFVLFRRSMAAGSVAVYDSAVVPVMRRVEALLPPPFGKNILLVAERL